MDWGCEVGQVVLSKPKVLQEPREEARHPGFNQLSQLLSGLSKGGGGGNVAAGGGVGSTGMNAILQQLAPQFGSQLASTANRAALNGAELASTATPCIVEIENDVAENGAVGGTVTPAHKTTNQIEELAHLFLGVLSGVLTEKLVRSISSAYEVTLENVDAVSGEQLIFHLDLKHGLGKD